MKKLLRKISEWFCFFPKTPKTSNQDGILVNKFPSPETINNAVDEIVDTLSNDEEKKMAFWEVEEDLSLRPLNDCALRSSPTLKKSVPKDATEKQNLTKYNNPETVYRNSKGRFAKLN